VWPRVHLQQHAPMELHRTCARHEGHALGRLANLRGHLRDIRSPGTSSARASCVRSAELRRVPGPIWSSGGFRYKLRLLGIQTWR